MKFLRHPTLQRGPKKHHPLTRALHWGTVFCILIAVSAILLREGIGDKHWRMLLLETHRQLGLIILLGVAARLYVRQRHGMADHMHGLPVLMRMAASATHWCLYALLVGLPLLGWASTNAHNLNLHFLGVIQLPTLAAVDSELADQLSDYHVLGAWILLGVLTMHIGAALFHHFIRRDSVLWAMLPDLPDSTPVIAPVRRRARRARHGVAE
jgi:cytochrome b561